MPHITIELEKETHSELKIKAIRAKKTLQDYVSDMIEEDIRDHGEKEEEETQT